jgi:FixJ family two-component response regulator
VCDTSASKPKYDFLTVPWGALYRSATVLCISGRNTILSPLPVISIIDDDASIRVATNSLVRSLGYAVHSFGSAEEFLQSTHINDTCCVIADVQMPGMSGVELQSLLLARGVGMPFIFITAFPDENIRARALKAGAIGFLTKPFDGQILVKCLCAAVQGDAGSDK